MTTYTSQDFLAVAVPRFRFLKAQQDRLRQEEEAFDEDIARLEALHERARQEMASYLLAEVGDDDIDALQARLQYPGLMAIKDRFEAELAAAEAARVELEASPEIEHYDFHVSHTQDELDALSEACKSYRGRMESWQKSRWFLELDGRGFFDRSYRPSFFNHFWDWRAVSWLMDDVEDKLDLDFATPEQVRDAWVALRDEALPVLEAENDLAAKLQALVHLKARHEALRAAPEQIFQRLIHALGEAVLDHLDSCSEHLKLSMANEDRYLVTFFKKDTGLERQIQYLKELKVARIQPLIQSINAEMAKLSQKVTKAQRKFKTYDARTIMGMRDLKEEKWAKRHTRLGKIRGRVAGFKTYEQGDFTEDYLWWDLMTRGAPADDIYEVRTFRRRRPGWNYRTHEDRWGNHHHHPEPSRTAMDDAADELTERMHPSDDDDWSLDAS